LIPFRRAIEAGADCVMTAHVFFPALTSENMLPATLSSAIIQGLLREQMGFQGIMISDCLEMQAISETFGTERGAVMALQAGNDLVLVSHLYERQRGSFEAIQAAVQTNELSPQTIQRAAERVLRLKASRMSWDTLPSSTAVPTLIGCEAHLQLQKRAYERMPVLVRSEDGFLPLHRDSGDRIVVISPERYSMSKVECRYYSDNVLV